MNTEEFRPKSFEEFVGQKHLVSEQSPLFRMVKSKKLQSLIFHGPPGTGKTSLAQIIAKSMEVTSLDLNAVKSTIEEMRNAVILQKQFGNVVLIIDEIHRLDKKKQDFLLPYIEHDGIILIGTTTENPYFECSNAIRSRCIIFEFKSLSVVEIAKKLHEINQKYYSEISYDYEVNNMIAKLTNGDIRIAFNYLQLLLNNYEESEITTENVKQIFQSNIIHDKNGEHHHNLLSAIQKSIRASDVNAALHYLVRLLEVGDYKAICRRLLVIAYEDIGLANPQLCGRSISAIETFERIGMPEGRIPLSVIVCDLALSPKSNSAYQAIDQAYLDFHKINSLEINPNITYFQVNKNKYNKEEVKSINLLPEKYQNSIYYQPQVTSKYENGLAKNYYFEQERRKNEKKR